MGRPVDHLTFDFKYSFTHSTTANEPGGKRIMVWQAKSPGRRFMEETSSRSLTTNETCFIRKDHKCGKIFGASKSCFVACPSNGGIETILEIIAEKSAKHGVDATIAVRERAYGQDIFCTKICGKIIESKFCLVILDDMIEKGKNIPNPNVYYEYGLMTALNKHIIPLQNEKLGLAFNIQSYDTIKYNDKNIGPELERAIRDAIRITGEKKEERKTTLPDKQIQRTLETSGFQVKGERWYYSEVIDDTGFIGYSLPEDGPYAYVGRIDRESEFDNNLSDLKVAIYRTEKKVEALRIENSRLKKLKEELNKESAAPGLLFSQRYRNLEYGLRSPEDVESVVRTNMAILGQSEKMYLAFIIAPSIDRSAFEKEAIAEISKNKRFDLSVGDYKKIKIGEHEVTFTTSSMSG